MAGEMLEAGCDPGVPHAAHIGGDHRGRHGRVVAEGAVADDDVAGIGVDVRHGGEIDVQTVSFQVRADREGGVVGILRGASGREGCGAVVARHVEGRIAGDAAHAPALFVYAKQGSAGQRPQLRPEAQELLRIRDVVAVEQHAADRVALRPFPHAAADRLQAVRRQLRVAVIADRRLQRLRPHDKQLSDLLSEGKGPIFHHSVNIHKLPCIWVQRMGRYEQKWPKMRIWVQRMGRYVRWRGHPDLTDRSQDLSTIPSHLR